MIIKKLLAVCAAITIIGTAAAAPVGSPSAVCPITASAAERGSLDALAYVKFDDHVEITYCDEDALGAIVIPGEIDGLPVTVIGESAFEDCHSITSVVIPDSVTTIRESAFYNCDSLTDITIPESVTDIEGVAFINTPWLERKQEEDPLVIVNNILIDARECVGSVAVPEGVKRIGDYSFTGNFELTEVIIPEGVEAVGDYAFVLCLYLTSVKISESVETIGNGAFAFCADLPTITIPASVISIGEAAFAFCPELKTVAVLSPDCMIFSDEQTFFNRYEEDDNGNTTYYFDGTFYGWDGSTTQDFAGKFGYKFSSLGEAPDMSTGKYGKLSYKKHDGYMEIIGCEKSAEGELVIPDTIRGLPVTTIGDNAFSMCGKLTKISIPEKVDLIGSSAFEGCESLTSVSIPGNVDYIGDNAFCRCVSLKSITLPESLEVIGSGAFSGCEGLVRVTMKDGVKSIGDGAFEGCRSLQSIDIPASIKEICTDTFSGCSSLTNVTIPENVTKIGRGAFAYCSELRSVMILNPECDITSGSYTFFNEERDDSSDIISDGLSYYYAGVICGYTDSTAQTYAKKFKREFVAIDVDDGLGDVNGDGMVDAVDASEVLAEYARLSAGEDRSFDETKFSAADVNLDGFTDAVDASNILSYYAYLSVTEGEAIPMRAFLIK